jgi:1,4-alpha-glucan branching enzyme
MGGEFAQRSEWNHDAALEWGLLADPRHSGVSALIASLNRLYRETTALHECDCDPGGFEWVQANAREDSVFAFLRWDRARSRPVLAVFNFTPVVRAGYLVGVPIAGSWRSVLNTADAMFGGEGFDPCDFKAQRKALDNQPCSLSVDLPALSGLLLVPGEHL